MTEETDLVVLNIKRPDEALFKRSENALETARGIDIRTSDEAVLAGKDLKAIKALSKKLEAKRIAITKPLNQALREVNALFKPAKNWLAEAERLLKSKILEFQNEQERIAREAQAKADEEARKEREKLERKAKLAAVVGMEEKAEELREEAETQIAPVVKSAAPKLSGIARRETWKAEVFDSLALLQHIVADRHDLLPLVRFDQAELNKLARRHKDEFNLPGVDVVKEASIAARG